MNYNNTASALLVFALVALAVYITPNAGVTPTESREKVEYAE
jgi:hypothetical protein